MEVPWAATSGLTSDKYCLVCPSNYCRSSGLACGPFGLAARGGCPGCTELYSQVFAGLSQVVAILRRICATRAGIFWLATHHIATCYLLPVHSFCPPPVIFLAHAVVSCEASSPSVSSSSYPFSQSWSLSCPLPFSSHSAVNCSLPIAPTVVLCFLFSISLPFQSSPSHPPLSRSLPLVIP